MPSGWIECKLGDFFRKRSDSGLSDLPTASVTLDRGLVLRKNLDRKMETTLEAHQHLLVRKGDIAYNMMRMWQGALGLAEFDCIVSPAYVVCEPKDGSVCSRYFYYLFKTLPLIKKFKDSSRGLTEDRLRLYYDDFERIKIRVPSSFHEQERIAKILSVWDEAIEKIEAIVGTKEKKRSHHISRILNPHQTGWKTYRISELGELVKGKGIAKSEVIASGIPCIRYGEVYTTHHIVIRKFQSYISRETAQNSRRLNKGDIVFAGSGETAEEIGKAVAYLGDEEAYVGGDTIVLSPSDHSSLFLSYLFNSSYTRKQLNVLGQGNAVVHIYPRDLADVAVSVPGFERQIKIAAYLNSIDEEILVYKKMAEGLKTQKQGLMQQLLTGKKRVKL